MNMIFYIHYLYYFYKNIQMSMIPHLFLHYYFLFFFEKVMDEYCIIEEEGIFLEDKIVENLGEI